MSWWNDITDSRTYKTNFHVGDDVADRWNALKNVGSNAITSLNPFANVGTKDNYWQRIFKNVLIPGWGTRGGTQDDVTPALMVGATDPVQQVNNSAAEDAAKKANEPITDTNNPEPELVLDDSNDPNGVGTGNILLRRRKLQNAMKYGFASTIKHYMGNTKAPMYFAPPKELVA